MAKRKFTPTEDFKVDLYGREITITQKSPLEYVVKINRMVMAKDYWVLCPHCKKKAFVANILKGSLGYKCQNTHPETNKKCKAEVRYVFSN